MNQNMVQYSEELYKGNRPWIVIYSPWIVTERKLMNKNYLGADIAKLGFGLMRLPMLKDEIDLEQTKKMADLFMQKGFTYFDTAYVYTGGKSEVAMRAAVVKRYPRASFPLATKLPVWDVKSRADMDRV